MWRTICYQSAPVRAGLSAHGQASPAQNAGDAGGTSYAHDVRTLVRLICVLGLCLVAFSAPAHAAIYSGGIGAPGGGAPGGGGGGGPVTFYDLARTDDTITFPTVTRIREQLCPQLYRTYVDGAGLPTGRRKLALANACTEQVMASVTGLTRERSRTILTQSANGDECVGVDTGACIVQTNPHNVTPQLYGKGGYWSEFVVRSYSAGDAPSCQANNGTSSPNCLAKNVVAWNVKIWRYLTQRPDGSPATQSATQAPIFERRAGIDPDTAATDDGLLASCPPAVSLRPGCTSYAMWWRGGPGQPQNGEQTLWWSGAKRGGALGPLPLDLRTNASGAGDASDIRKVQQGCANRWDDYKDAYPSARAGRTADTSLWSWLAPISPSLATNVCFWPGTYTWTDVNGQPRREGIALGWGFSPTGLTESPFRFKIEGPPGAIYVVQVTGIDEREQIVRRGIRVFYAQTPTPAPTSRPDPSCPTTDPYYPTCDPPEDTPDTPTPTEQPSPKPVLRPFFNGPSALTTGDPGEYALLVDTPRPQIEETQAAYPLRSWISLVEPQAKAPGATTLDGSGTAAGPSFYEQLMLVREGDGGNHSQRSYGIGQFFGTHYVRQTHQTAPGVAFGLDWIPRRDETGAFGNNADLNWENPLIDRRLISTWRVASLSPDKVVEDIGTAPDGSGGGIRTRYADGAVAAGALEYESGSYTQTFDPAWEKAGAISLAQPQRTCSTQPNGRWCIERDDSIRRWDLPGYSRNGRRVLSDHHPGRHQLAQAYQLHDLRGVFRVRLETNRPELVDHLDIYDRNPDAAGRRVKRLTREQARQPDGSYRWEITYCRSGAYSDQVRRYRGNIFNLSTYEPVQLGDDGCRDGYSTWQWATSEKKGPYGDAGANVDCRPTPPTTSSGDWTAGLPDPAGRYVDLGGDVPWAANMRESCTYYVPGYQAGGQWDTEPWQWMWYSDATPAQRQGMTACFRPESGTTRFPNAPDGTQGPAFRPRGSCPAGQRPNGWWWTPGLVFRWQGQCVETRQPRPGVPGNAIWGNRGPIRPGGGFVRGTDNPPLVAREVGSQDDCSPIAKRGYKHAGSWVRTRDADPAYNSARDDNRLDPGEYVVSADFASGDSSVDWRLVNEQYQRKGSRWEFETRTSFASPVETIVTSLQTTR